MLQHARDGSIHVALDSNKLCVRKRIGKPLGKPRVGMALVDICPGSHRGELEGIPSYQLRKQPTFLTRIESYLRYPLEGWRLLESHFDVRMCLEDVSIPVGA